MPSAPVQVVIIDDDSSVRWIIEQTLEMGGVNYASATTGVKGVELINRHTPPLAIVDLKLGAMSGLDVVRSIDNGCTRVLMVTGYAPSIKGHISGLPILQVIEKPFDIQELLQIVNEALRVSA